MSNSNAGKGDRPRPVDLQKYEQNWENIFRKKTIEDGFGSEWSLCDRKKTIEDGFGSEWSLCDRKDCGLHVVRPGKVQCNLCD